MSANLDLVLLWHMHQPDYRDQVSGEFQLPWVYLHAVKDYTDMAAHLEAHPAVRAVVNFVPVLLDQIEDYTEQFASGRMRDPLLALLAREDLDHIGEAERKLIFDSCFRSNHSRMIVPFPAYKYLHDLYADVAKKSEACYAYLSGQYLADLLTWYHLVWTGESVRRESALVAGLMSKGSNFSYDERRQLFDLIGALIGGLIGRYRKLAESGQIELSATPHQHPLAPLLLDFQSARDAEPESPLPQAPYYPGGRSRVTHHVRAAQESHARRFGARPKGLWPAEGGVSSALLKLFAEQQVGWAASGEGVLANSLRKTGAAVSDRREYLYRPYRVAAAPEVSLFFRDDQLSDLIGFEYAKWHGKDAAYHFVGQLEAVRRDAPAGRDPLVVVILDGENAWEYYPYNGFHFLNDLYTTLGAHASIRTTTPSAYLARERQAVHGELPALCAGSWVYGTFSTWIGSTDKNRAWDLLCAAKASFDLVLASGRLGTEAAHTAERQLAVCEASDWFWWFGDYNPQQAVSSFDRLFRHNLTNLYRLLELPPPPELAEPISHGAGHPEAGGAMRRAS
ncbi:MAG TPA: glycoside hydrolase family 57 protein [Burkholderiales bacterium]|nr:glycoside hydrolase family 57 protein [Burkholderiales bacterium]